MLKVVASDKIVRYRGDTLGDKVIITSDGVLPQDITGYTARLTVNLLADPGPTDLPLFELTGVIDDAPGGVFVFSPTPLQADQAPGKYFYDVELTTPSGRIVTVAKGVYQIKQDIGK